MGNPFMAAMSGAKGPQGGPMGFVQFMQQMRGQDPQKILDDMMSSGKINQNQLNQAQQMAKKVEGQLSGFRSMFGF